MRIIILSLILLGLCSPNASAAQGSLVFRVVDADNKPVPGAKLTCRATPTPNPQPPDSGLTTNENGEYVFRWEVPHEFEQFEVLVEKPNHAVYLARWMFLAAEPLPETYTAKLAPGFAMRWHLTDVKQENNTTEDFNIPGVKVSTKITLQDRIGRDWKHTFEIVTDEQGVGVFESVPNEWLGKEMEFAIRHPNYREANQKLAFRKGGYHLSLVGLRKAEEPTPEFPKSVLLPELPRPDYSSITEGFDVSHIAELLETMRTDLNSLNTEEDCTDNGGRSRLFQHLTKISEYLVFLQDAGLIQDAQTLLDDPGFHVYGPYQLSSGFNLVETVKTARHRRGRSDSRFSPDSREQIESNFARQILNALRTPQGFRYYEPPERKTIYPDVWKNITVADQFAINQDRPEQIIIFKTLPEMVAKYMQTFNVKEEEIPEIVKRFENPTNVRYQMSGHATLLGYAIALCALDRQEEADALIEKASQLADKNLEKILNDPKAVEPMMTYASTKISFVKALIRMKRYEKAFAVMQEAKAFFDKLKSEGKHISWNSSWDNPLQDVVRWFAYDGEIELGLRTCREMFISDSSAKLALKYMAEALAELGRFDDAREINKLVSNPTNDGQWIDKMEARRTAPPPESEPTIEQKQTSKEKILKSIAEKKTPAQKVQQTILEIDKILAKESVDQEFVRELLLQAHRTAQEIPLNPGDVRYHLHYHVPEIEYRDEAMREITGMALYADCEDEAQEWLAQCQELDAKLPKIQRKELSKYFSIDSAPLLRDRPWIKYARRFMKVGEEKIDKAVICVTMLHDIPCRIEGCQGVLNVLVPNPEKKGD